jgi:bacterioferritin-associated ferredoxin
MPVKTPANPRFAGVFAVIACGKTCGECGKAPT